MIEGLKVLKETKDWTSTVEKKVYINGEESLDIMRAKDYMRL